MIETTPEDIIWTPLLEFRWGITEEDCPKVLVKTAYNLNAYCALQQKFVSDTGKEEWRVVPLEI